MKDLHSRSFRLPLAFGNRHARVDEDPDHLAQLVSRAVPLRELSPRSSASPFVHRSVHVQAAQLGITAAAHSPLRGANHAQSKAVFTLPIVGEKNFLIEGTTHQARAGYNALFLPGDAYSLETTCCSGVMFSMCPLELASLANTMAGPEARLRFDPIQRPVELLESHPQQGKILALLRRSLGLIDLAILRGTHVPKQLGLDDKVQRLMALLIYPQLTAPKPPQLSRCGQRERDSFYSLVAAIQDDLLADWTLTRMERQAALGRGQLQELFYATFGSGAMEWLRHQRLCWARHRLDATPAIPMDQLALQCGYLDLQSFLEDFENHFFLSPESLKEISSR